MSYARWGCDGSDVYMYGAGYGEQDVIVCCDCKLHDHDQVFDIAGAIEHLLKHRAEGHTVPEYAIERLKEEQKEEGECSK